MKEVKHEGLTVNPVSIRCTSFSFRVNQTSHSGDMAHRVLQLTKLILNLKENCQNNSYGIAPQYNQVIGMARGRFYQVL